MREIITSNDVFPILTRYIQISNQQPEIEEMEQMMRTDVEMINLCHEIYEIQDKLGVTTNKAEKTALQERLQELENILKEENTAPKLDYIVGKKEYRATLRDGRILHVGVDTYNRFRQHRAGEFLQERFPDRPDDRKIWVAFYDHEYEVALMYATIEIQHAEFWLPIARNEDKKEYPPLVWIEERKTN